MKKCLFFLVVVLLINLSTVKAQWIQTAGPAIGYTEKVVNVNGNIVAGSLNGGTSVSQNEGTSWNQSVPSALTNSATWSLYVYNGTIVAGTWNGNIFLSTNCGWNWNQTSFSISSPVTCFTASGGNLFAGTFNNGAFVSTNNGWSWNPINTGLGSASIMALTASGNNIFAGTTDHGVFISTNNGGSWTATNNGLSSAGILSLVVSGGNIFAGTNGAGIFLSTNNGASWSPVNYGLTNNNIWSLAAAYGNIFAGTSNGGIYLSVNNGASWTCVNTGLSNGNVNSIVVVGNNVYAATHDGSGVWRRSLANIGGITGVESNQKTPSNFSLFQNFPNPFNPTTEISFSVPAVSHVTLDVYNILGERVATLVDKEEPIGNYSIVFDGSKLASGMYIYRLQAGNFIESKKMIQMK
jgi:hypothetical protein